MDDPEIATRNPDSNEIFLSEIPHPHGDHFHIGRKVVSSRDATGLSNEAVWVALQRKGLIKSFFPGSVIITPEGLLYDTGLAQEILHESGH